MQLTHTHAARAAALLVTSITLGATGLTAQATPVAQGVTYDLTSRLQVLVQGTEPREIVAFQAHGATLGGNARIEITGGEAPAIADRRGSYMLVLDSGRRYVWVDAARKQYFESDLKTMLAPLTAGSAMPGMQVTLSDVKVDAARIGPGEAILGYPTDHYHLTQDVTVNVQMMGVARSQRVESASELYYAPSLKGIINPFMQTSQNAMPGVNVTNNDALIAQLKAAEAKLPHDAPIKTVMTMTLTNEGAGMSVKTATTTEATNVTRTAVSPALFAIPAGFTKVDAPKQGTAASAPGAPGRR